MKTKMSNRNEIRNHSVNLPLKQHQRKKVDEMANEMGVSRAEVGRVALEYFYDHGYEKWVEDNKRKF